MASSSRHFPFLPPPSPTQQEGHWSDSMHSVPPPPPVEPPPPPPPMGVEEKNWAVHEEPSCRGVLLTTQPPEGSIRAGVLEMETAFWHARSPCPSAFLSLGPTKTSIQSFVHPAHKSLTIKYLRKRGTYTLVPGER